MWAISYARHYKPRFVGIYYPIFEVHFFVLKEVFLKNSVLMFISIQERVMMARIRYISKLDSKT